VPPSWGAAAWDRIEELNIVQTRWVEVLLIFQDLDSYLLCQKNPRSMW
jgi:hypothetical protein